MAVKIESLTEAQKALFPVYVKKWTDIGLSTEKVDRDAANAAIRQCYEKAEIAPPKKIVWSKSPLLMLFARAVFMEIAKRKAAANA